MGFGRPQWGQFKEPEEERGGGERTGNRPKGATAQREIEREVQKDPRFRRGREGELYEGRRALRGSECRHFEKDERKTVTLRPLTASPSFYWKAFFGVFFPLFSFLFSSAFSLCFRAGLVWWVDGFCWMRSGKGWDTDADSFVFFFSFSVKKKKKRDESRLRREFWDGN